MVRLRNEFDVTFFDGVHADNRFYDAVKRADGIVGANVPLPNALLDQAPNLKIASSIQSVWITSI
jgi:glyoxylate/hydroxypyruvate/2-ketogluconate reductase